MVGHRGTEKAGTAGVKGMGGTGGATAGKDRAKHGKGKKAIKDATSVPENEEGDGRYVVVVTNVENDFAKVHQSAVLRFCRLDENHRRGFRASFIKQTEAPDKGAESGAAIEQSRRQCRFTVTPRSETRSVEVAVYGTPDGDVSSVFLPLRQLAHKEGGRRLATAGKEEDEPSKDGDGAFLECLEQSKGSGTFFDSLEDMVATLQNRPYFTHPPKIFLNIPDKKNGEVLRTVNTHRQSYLNDTKAPQKRKRDAACKGDEANASAKVERSSEHGVEPDDAEHLLAQEVKQSTVRQAEMATAVAATSARMCAKDLQSQMGDIPGFVACWRLYQQHFRVLFTSKDALFRAKLLLDQFEVDARVRVSITLSDNATKEFDNYVAAQEGAI
ncbi:hypothetical protein ERJ75_000996900 [Trypanosoma vivax]|uniref:Uncharacterized protein n=1 Tax=Trypanosoma vivax (strain Y486) TaxID=1055687 RepID=G0UAT3_TRYVY|nr:hypothetical protein TRVL_02144 [Trypanosoma vivax]KAH8611239.1 hypothetical protein ERJ75_000996900 [Trypanosoma vivax]CCC52920.1 conserved hypothetical protein [Trypanosoma vivax Y486]